MTRRRPSLAKLFPGLLVAVAVLGGLCLAVLFRPPDSQDMAIHWTQFAAAPTWLHYQTLHRDVKACPRPDCLAWAGLNEPQVARLVALAQAGNARARQISILVNQVQSDNDIGAEDMVLCCGALIRSDPQTFLRLTVKEGFHKTAAVTSTQAELDEDYTACDRELKARRAALMSVQDADLRTTRDAFVQALDQAILANASRVGGPNDEGAKASPSPSASSDKSG